MQIGSTKRAQMTGWWASLAARRGAIGLLAGALASGALGFAFGPAVVGGLSHAVTAWLLPTFMTIYLAGLALCA